MRSSLAARRLRLSFLCLSLPLIPVGCGTRHALGGGFGWGATDLSDSPDRWGPDPGPVLSARFLTPEIPFRGLLAIDLQPFTVQNPERTRHFRVLYLQPQLQYRPAPFFFRGGLGLALFSFGGSRDPRGTYWGPSIGVGAGIDLTQIAGRDWSIEAYLRGGGPWEGEIETELAGVQLSTYVH